MKPISIILLCLIMLLSCKKEQHIETSCQSVGFTENYFPLEVGNRWIYHFYNIDSLGNKIDTVTNLTQLEILRKQIIGGKEYFVLNSQFNSDFTFPRYIRKEDHIYYGLTSETDLTERIFMHDTPKNQSTVYPLEILSTDPWAQTSLGPIMVTHKVSYSNNLTVPLGTYNVRNASITYFNPKGFTYLGLEETVDRQFSDGVGPVRFTSFFFGGINFTEFVLIDYSLQ